MPRVPAAHPGLFRSCRDGPARLRALTALEASGAPLVVVMGDYAFDPSEKGYFPILKDYLGRHFVQSESVASFRILERVAP